MEVTNNEKEVSLGINLSEGQSIVVPIIEEKILLDKKMVETGNVRISKRVFEEQSTIDTLITSEEVLVERKEINQYVDVAPPAVRQEGDVTIISVIKEVLVIEKRLMLVEELYVTKSKKQQTATVSEMVRKEEVNITRNPSGTEF